MQVIIINGPNLNLLGDRNPDLYGEVSFGDYYKKEVLDIIQAQKI